MPSCECIYLPPPRDSDTLPLPAGSSLAVLTRLVCDATQNTALILITRFSCVDEPSIMPYFSQLETLRTRLHSGPSITSPPLDHFSGPSSGFCSPRSGRTPHSLPHLGLTPSPTHSTYDYRSPGSSIYWSRSSSSESMASMTSTSSSAYGDGISTPRDWNHCESSRPATQPMLDRGGSLTEPAMSAPASAQGLAARASEEQPPGSLKEGRRGMRPTFIALPPSSLPSRSQGAACGKPPRRPQPRSDSNAGLPHWAGTNGWRATPPTDAPIRPGPQVLAQHRSRDSSLHLSSDVIATRALDMSCASRRPRV